MFSWKFLVLWMGILGWILCWCYCLIVFLMLEEENMMNWRSSYWKKFIFILLCFWMRWWYRYLWYLVIKNIVLELMIWIVSWCISGCCFICVMNCGIFGMGCDGWVLINWWNLRCFFFGLCFFCLCLLCFLWILFLYYVWIVIYNIDICLRSLCKLLKLLWW